MDERTRILSQVPGLSELVPDELVDLSRLFELRVFAEETICKEGDSTDHLWVLAHGAVDVIKSTPGRGPFHVASLSPTCLIGHAGLMGATERTASLIARGQVEVLEVSTQAARLMLDTADFPVASPFRRALIVDLSRQLGLATETVGRLAVEVGISENIDAEERLLQAGHRL